MEKTAKNVFNSKRRSEIKFITLSLIYPMIIFAIFYLYVNFNSIMLSMKTLNDNGKFVFADDLLVNFKKTFRLLTSEFELTRGLRNQVIIYLYGIFINQPFQIIISYYMWRKIPLNGFFRVVIFIPSIVSTMVYVTIGRYIFTEIIPLIVGNPKLRLLADPNTQFISVFIYSILIGVGGNIVYYLGAISSVDASVVEYGKLDGLNSFGELWHIVLPHVWPTMISFIIVTTSQFFTEKLMLYDFFGGGAEPSASTLGYYYFRLVFSNNTLNVGQYPEGAAAGLIFTIIAVPFTFGIKYLLERFGPSED